MHRTGARGVFAFVLTTGVMREFVFYVAGQPDFAAIHEAIMARVTTHGVQCLAEHDANWNAYQQFAVA